MKFLIGLLIIFSTIAGKSQQVSQSGKSKASAKKQEQKDIDSLFIVYSLPINVSHSDNFYRVDIQDSLIELLKQRKYNHLDRSAYEALFKAKQFEVIPRDDPKRMHEVLEKIKNDENYLYQLLEAADPYLQLIQLSFLKKDSGLNYINIRRFNLPSPKQRNWVFTYHDSETSGHLAARILDSLIIKRQALSPG